MKNTNEKNRFNRLAAKQRGFGIVSALLALVIGAVVAVGQVEGIQAKRQTSAGALQGDVLNLVKGAANAYAMENYPALQLNQAVTRNGVTLAVGTTAGQAMAPRVEDLVAMGYLNPGTSSQATAVEGGVYRINFRREPVGCVGVACNIPGTLHIDQAILVRGTTEMNGVVIGALMERVGGDVLVALNSSPTVLTAVNGANAANPVTGTPPGVVAVRVGFGAIEFGRYLVLNDPRDPNFRGNVTVAGTLSAARVTAPIIIGDSIGAGTGTGGCRLGEIMVSGQIVSRSTACIRRAWLDGATGQVGVADTAGTTRALLNGSTGAITSRDATGTVRAGFSYQSGESVAFADNVRNNASTGGILPNGTIYGTQATFASGAAGVTTTGGVFGTAGVFNSITINNSASIGTACSPSNAAVWGYVGAAPVLLKCESGVWRSANGSNIATVGSACTVANQQGTTTLGVGLICHNNAWMRMTDRMGTWAVAETVSVADGTVVTKPACSSGGLPRIFSLPQGIDSSALYVNFYAVDNGASWTARITDGQLNGLSNGGAVAQTGCFYL